MSYKRKADEMAGESLGAEKKAKRHEVVCYSSWPARPVDTFGWNTALPKNRKLHKTAVMDQYQLSHDDLEDLNFETKARGDGYMYLYTERDVEWKAWQVHGGPDGLWHLLRQLREENVQSGATKPFPCPYEYTRGRTFDLDRLSPPCCDRYLMGHPAIISAKAELPSWFWIECNFAVDRALRNGERPSGYSAAATTERVYAIRAAKKFFHRHSARYSGRPARPLIPHLRASAIWTFRELLEDAPTISTNLRGTDAWGPPKERLLFRAASGDYEWDSEYLAELFGSLCQLIKQLGLGDYGWRSIRWELYYKFAAFVDGGLRYDARGRCWTDPAGEWLEGQIDSQFVPGTMRGRCAEGFEYNNLLPAVDEALRIPPPGYARALSGTPSPVRVPVAGPSSA